MGTWSMITRMLFLSAFLSVYELFFKHVWYAWVRNQTGSQPNIGTTMMGYFLVIGISYMAIYLYSHTIEEGGGLE